MRSVSAKTGLLLPQAPKVRSAHFQPINYMFIVSMCWSDAKLIISSSSLHRNRLSKREKTLVVQEKIALSWNRFVDNPNYLEEKQQLLSSLGKQFF